MPLIAEPVVLAQRPTTETSQQAPTKRLEFASGLVASAVVHTALFLLLSLIAITTQTTSVFNSLVLSESSDSLNDIAETPAFEVSAVAEAPELTVTPLTAEMNVQLASPLISVKPQEISVAAPSVTQPAENDGSAMKGAVNKAVEAIQGRVSKSGGKQGEVQFALAWRNINDVDLHVITPSGEHISHIRRQSSCRGKLDVDMNVSGESREPVENIRWLDNAPAGRYTVLVNLFRVHTPDNGRPNRQSPFQLLVHMGDETIVRDGLVRNTAQVAVLRFQYFPPQYSSDARERLQAELNELQTAEEAVAAPILAAAKRAEDEEEKNQLLREVVMRFPHSDAAVQALRLMGGEVVKR